jgi:hypothetical protein
MVAEVSPAARKASSGTRVNCTPKPVSHLAPHWQTKSRAEKGKEGGSVPMPFLLTWLCCPGAHPSHVPPTMWIWGMPGCHIRPGSSDTWWRWAALWGGGVVGALPAPADGPGSACHSELLWLPASTTIYKRGGLPGNKEAETSAPAVRMAVLTTGFSLNSLVGGAPKGLSRPTGSRESHWCHLSAFPKGPSQGWGRGRG